MLRVTARPLRSKGCGVPLESVQVSWPSFRCAGHAPTDRTSSSSCSSSSCSSSSCSSCSSSSSGGCLCVRAWAGPSRGALSTAFSTRAASGAVDFGFLGGRTSASSRVSAAAAMSSASAAATAPTAADVGSAASGLWADIVRVYERAEASGACSKTETQVETCADPALGVEFVLRVAAALKAKPQGPQAAPAQPAPAQPNPQQPPPPPPPAAWRNPFLPPDPDLFVCHLGPQHSLVLNKFNVVAHHAIVITREFRSQAEPLYGPDLAAALEVVQAMPGGGLAFYNCGPASGRSQPHKHLQVVPLPFKDGQPPLAPVHCLVEAAAASGGPRGAAPAPPLQPLELRQAPYRCFATLLPDSPTPEQLEAGFNSLLQLAFPGYTYEPPAALRDGPPADAASAAAAAAGSVSYNVLLTRQWLMLAPRRAERCGSLAPNSLAFAGTMLVRSADELDFVRQTGPSSILAHVGEPW